ncbi:hypothetical protein M2459_002639 [Parabacteroides sp. PF5-5]|uniref:hypothetical protein n=1 Tax=unclassified Parabacteroides TaxID=2649774 RepID=UPI00247462EC|nr:MULTISPECIES: hypothetical protein [unclassified Parabacteroides]MDH6306276.1 hypothetical protein [Parabacteroides sp. PH5-39]MDH6316933.1 hypothetical protein [Parabacteroides sp. PF5-13]MDH6321002.1 hypothetical protein [Parabacteroides sp. PH5-13]MDH6324734.1 hypothetical protein [Parabacteroides sp. PH5-8]MDH6328118.1 hypothetical protein [Parabacteroides sp. PH5-41]
MKLSKKSKKKVYVVDEIREKTVTEFVYRPMDLSLAKQYFPDLFKEYSKENKKPRLKPKKK